MEALTFKSNTFFHHLTNEKTEQCYSSNATQFQDISSMFKFSPLLASYRIP